jgi:hypothetical protein
VMQINAVTELSVITEIIGITKYYCQWPRAFRHHASMNQGLDFF